MRQIKKTQKVIRSVIIFFLLSTVPYKTVACTAFVIKGGGRQYLAKNLDWNCGQGYLIYNPASVVKYSLTQKGESISWISHYSSITFNQFGAGFPLGGMNSAGLVIEELNAPGGKGDLVYQAEVNEFQWIQYQLDNHSDVAGVIKSTQSIGVKPVFQNLHYIIMDIHGDVAIVEITDGEFKTYSGEEIRYSVLSNNLYVNSLRYLENFTGFGGEMPLAQGKDSQTRFVTIASKLKRYAELVPDKELAFQLLSEVSQDDTQWSIVYDNKESKIFFRESLSGEVVQFSFRKANTRYNRCYKFLDLSDCSSGEQHRRTLTADLNMQLFTRIGEDYRRAGISDKELTILKELFIHGSKNLQKGKKRFSREPEPAPKKLIISRLRVIKIYK